MKLVKLSVFALTMGLFLASCGDKGGDAAKAANDSAAAAAAAAPTTPPPAAEPAKTDTMTAGAAKPADSMAKADASKMDAKKK